MTILDSVRQRLVPKYCEVNGNRVKYVMTLEFNCEYKFTPKRQRKFIAKVRKRLAQKARKVYLLPYYGSGKDIKKNRFFLHIEEFWGDIKLFEYFLQELGLSNNSICC